jgi:RNA polymerase sigma-70 factor, ECF subfamily
LCFILQYKKRAEMDETELIQSAQKGSLEAFNRLVLDYQDIVFNVAFRVIGDPNEADDITQNAFIAAYNNLKKFRGGSFKAWILRIATNLCYDELRRQKRRPTSSLEPTNNYGEEIESPQWIVDDNPGPEESSETAELEQAIQDCLNDLPEDFRAMIVLIDIQGLDYQETSSIIKSPLGTIKSRLARARLKMRDCLQGFQELLPAQFRLEGEGV